MRAGGCTIQQALTADAATVVKQAVALARRRGHAQVTPLHVANTMLTSSTGLLRTACLQSHSHPLQCKALELCFNVALNRLPASSSAPILPSSHHSQHFPAISNALVAAFKRAQAHQRRGSVENQQQPLLAVKIELEQLTISILDDPSVSRVMREAGFSSTQVKSNVEQTVSLDICSPSNSLNGTTKTKPKEIINISNTSSSSKVLLDPIRDEDVMCVIEGLMVRRRRSVVIIGECVVSMESVVKGVMERVERAEVAEELREVKFITLPLASFGHLSRLEIEQKVEEVKNHVRRFMSKGVVLNLGDLKWVIEKNRATSGGYSYCPMEHMIMELGKLDSNGGGERFWIMGVATFQTYMKCKSSHVWGNFHPITIPAGSLRLSLISTDHSDVQLQSDQPTIKKVGNGSSSSSNWIILEGKDEMNHHHHQQQQLSCCSECSTKFETEARSLKNNTTCNSDSSTSTLPAWLQKCKNENNGLLTSNLDQDSVTISDLRKKWNSICSSIHRLPSYSNNSAQRTLTFSCVSPSSSTSGFSYTKNLHQHHHHRQDWTAVQPDQPYWVRNQNPTLTTSSNIEPNLRIHINPDDQKKILPLFSPNSTSSGDIMEVEYPHEFKEVTAENLRILCNALEKKVPWQKDIIPEIASTVLQCRAGMVRRKGKISVRNVDDEIKNETWLFFQGIDMEAKEKIAKELGRLVFGSSSDNFISISLSSFSSTRADSSDQDCRNKRSRDEQSCSYIERFSDAVSRNPHRVFLVEDVEQADYCSQIGFKRAMEVGRVSNSWGEEVGLSDAIIILSCESFSSRSRACSPPIKQKMVLDDQSLLMVEEEEEKEMMSPNFVSLDLNISIDGCGIGDDESIDDVGLLESVDRRIIFKIQEL